MKLNFKCTLQKKKRKTISKKETQNHIQKKKRKTTFKKRNAKPHWWHWEDNFNCCMVGPRISKFCAVGQRWPKSLLQKWRPWGPTIQQLKLSSQCHQYVVLRFFFWRVYLSKYVQYKGIVCTRIMNTWLGVIWAAKKSMKICRAV